MPLAFVCGGSNSNLNSPHQSLHAVQVVGLHHTGYQDLEICTEYRILHVEQELLFVADIEARTNRLARSVAGLWAAGGSAEALPYPCKWGNVRNTE